MHRTAADLTLPDLTSPSPLTSSTAIPHISGIGHLFHTSPTVPHYPGNKSKGKMEVGHIFTIEPMINIGRAKDGLWPDGECFSSFDDHLRSVASER